MLVCVRESQKKQRCRTRERPQCARALRAPPFASGRGAALARRALRHAPTWRVDACELDVLSCRRQEAVTQAAALRERETGPAPSLVVVVLRGRARGEPPLPHHRPLLPALFPTAASSPSPRRPPAPSPSTPVAASAWADLRRSATALAAAALVSLSAAGDAVAAVVAPPQTPVT